MKLNGKAAANYSILREMENGEKEGIEIKPCPCPTKRRGVLMPIEDPLRGQKPDRTFHRLRYYGHHCVTVTYCSRCGNEATHMAVFDGDGFQIIERFCDSCVKIYVIPA